MPPAHGTDAEGTAMGEAACGVLVGVLIVLVVVGTGANAINAARDQAADAARDVSEGQATGPPPAPTGTGHCPACGAGRAGDDQFCPMCGVRLARAAERRRRPGLPRQPGGSRARPSPVPTGAPPRPSEDRVEVPPSAVRTVRASYPRAPARIPRHGPNYPHGTPCAWPMARRCQGTSPVLRTHWSRPERGAARDVGARGAKYPGRYGT